MKPIRLPLALLTFAALLSACGAEITTSAAPAAPALAEHVAQGGANYQSATLPNPTGSSTATQNPVLRAQGDRQVIQNATLDLRIKSGAFDQAYSDALVIAQRWNGYLVSSHAGDASSDRIESGSLVLRIPAQNYADALSELRKLGTLTQIQVSSEDVTEQFVDLQARLRNQQAQQAVLLDLMRRAQSIQDSIAVQSQLSQVTGEIEQIEGQLQFLKTRTDFSTITLNLFVSAPVPTQPGLWERTGLGDAVITALKGSASVLGWMIVGLGFLAPVVVLLALGIGVFRLFPRRMLPNLREAAQHPNP